MVLPRGQGTITKFYLGRFTTVGLQPAALQRDWRRAGILQLNKLVGCSQRGAYLGDGNLLTVCGRSLLLRLLLTLASPTGMVVMIFARILRPISYAGWLAWCILGWWFWCSSWWRLLGAATVWQTSLYRWVLYKALHCPIRQTALPGGCFAICQLIPTWLWCPAYGIDRVLCAHQLQRACGWQAACGIGSTIVVKNQITCLHSLACTCQSIVANKQLAAGWHSLPTKGKYLVLTVGTATGNQAPFITQLHRLVSWIINAHKLIC